MKIGWLIDADMFEHYRDELVSAIRAHGHIVKLIHAPQPPYRWEDTDCSYNQAFSPETPVIALGDIELVTRIHRERRWTPGAFCTIENLHCSHYYCWLGSHLLNQNYVMLPFGELHRQKDFLFSTVGCDNCVFIRPDSPLKLFTGQIARRESFEADLEYMGFYDFAESSLVIVSAPKTILAEWRFVIVNKQVITGCQYKRNGQFDSQPGFEPSAFELAVTIARQEFQPDPVWVLDICQTKDGAFHLLEIGGFSFADLYACDKSSIVTSVAKAVVDAWQLSKSNSP